MATKAARRTATPIETYPLRIAKGRSHEVMSFLAQLDDQLHRLTEDLRGITTAELQWQPHKGMNTIGMLLAHIAIVEVYWLQVATQRISAQELHAVLGVHLEDDGMPLPRGAAPPAVLRGRPRAFYEKLLARSRRHISRILRAMPDSELERVILRTRRNGQRTKQSVRWILYHVLEHFAGHYGQVLLLRHWYRDRKKSA